MPRMIFQAETQLLDRVRRRARDRGVSIAHVIRTALERELADSPRPRLSSIGVAEGPGDLAARAEELYEPDPWRS